jgi:hypothetical protein
MKRQWLSALFFLASVLSVQAALSAQTASPKPAASLTPAASLKPAASSKPASDAQAPKGKAEYPNSFQGYSLGMGIDEVKSLLLKDGLLDYSGDPDVTLLPARKESLIDVQGPSYIKRASFQFVEDKLYVMVFHLDTTKLDYYSIFTSMSEKYGPPTALSPQESAWENESLRVSIERPLSVKYLDMQAYKALIESGAAEKSLREMRREDFIGSF